MEAAGTLRRQHCPCRGLRSSQMRRWQLPNVQQLLLHLLQLMLTERLRLGRRCRRRAGDAVPRLCVEAIKDISQAINCNHEHARRTLQSLMIEHQIARRKLPSTGGRPLYAYTENDFSYTPNTPH